MNWQPIYALLLLGATLSTYYCGLLLDKYKNSKTKKTILIIGIIINLSLLLIFKYYNFVNETIFSLLNYFGIRYSLPALKAIVPLGISFYVFRTIAYLVDVYRDVTKVEHDLLIHALFIAFFPTLIMGPIERANNLIPQLKVWHRFNHDYAIEGLKMMLWGYFMKLCVADRLGHYVDSAYNNVPYHNGTTLTLATIFYTFQIYCDFGGYSLIAIGAGRVMGFNLMENFRRPYLSSSMKDFWKRWHISLSFWFMDYVYIPLGGNKVPYIRNLFNLLITFLVSGAWHGASWNFIFWGGVHGIFLITENILARIFGKIKSKSLLIRLPKMLLCFALVCFTWIFFRANTISDAFEVIIKIFTSHGPIFKVPMVFLLGGVSLIMLIAKEIIDEFNLKLKFINSPKAVVSYVSCLMLLAYIVILGDMGEGQFIYFQF